MQYMYSQLRIDSPTSASKKKNERGLELKMGALHSQRTLLIV